MERVFEFFSERARQVIVLSQEEARNLKHTYIGTEHILLGLAREDELHGVGPLDSADVTPERVRAEVARIVGTGEAALQGQIPFTPRAKNVLGLARREAERREVLVDPEHLLMALFLEEEGGGGGVATMVLHGLDPSGRVHGELFGGRGDPSGTRSRWRSRRSRGRTARPFERFTERSRNVLTLAEGEARVLKHDYVGTEHVLLGLLREEEGLAARVLESLDITADAVRPEVARIVGRGGEVRPGELPHTPRVTKVLELSLREAVSLGHNYIGTEHILLGLVRETDGVGPRILLDFGADPDTIRTEVVRMLSGPGGRRPGREARSVLDVPDSLLDGADEPLRRLVHDIESVHGRHADAGDLLLLLALVPGGLAAHALAALGVDPERLARAVQEGRAAGVSSALLPSPALRTEIDETRATKDAAIEAQEYDRAANLRDRERELVTELRRAIDPRLRDELLAEARAQLGLDRG